MPFWMGAIPLIMFWVAINVTFVWAELRHDSKILAEGLLQIPNDSA